MVARRFGSAGDRVVLEECLVGTGGVLLRPVRRPLVRDDVVGAGPQAHLRRRPGTEHRRHGCVRAEPAADAGRSSARRDRPGGGRRCSRACAPRARRIAGFLYVGLMLTAAGPKVIEFNVRFGDPEAQVVLPMLDGRLADLLMAAATGALGGRPCPLPGRAARRRGGGRRSGYPDTPRTGQGRSSGSTPPMAVPGALVFHAGTADRDGAVVTAGGRVLTVVGRGPSYPARDRHRLSRRVATCASTACSTGPTSGRKASVDREVRRRHVRLPREPGRLAGDRGRAAARAAASACPPAQADVVVVNTCSVTGAADQGARQTVRKVARENPARANRGDRVLRDEASPTNWRRCPASCASCPITDKDRMAHCSGPCTPGAWSLEPERTRRAICRARRRPVRCAGWRPAWRAARRSRCACRPGCDERCSYCIIPGTRGAGRSKPVAWVLRAVDDAVGRRLPGDRAVRRAPGFVRARPGRRLVACRRCVRTLGDWPADVLFRISSLEPMDCTPELVAAVAASPRIAPHFHLPLQHGDDAMLRAMRRPYTADSTKRWSTGIAAAMPDVVDRHRRDRRVSRRDRRPGRRARRSCWSGCRSRYLHVFPYSDRPGTEASGMPDKIDGPAIRARAARLRAIGDRLSARFRASQVGKVRRALVVDDGSSVVTDNYLKLALDRPRTRNEWVDVLVEGPHRGRVVESRQSFRIVRRCVEPRKPPTPESSTHQQRHLLRGRLASGRPPRSADRTPRGCRARGSCAPTP